MPRDDLRATTMINPLDFVFFKGLNQPADRNGILTQNISGGLKAGNYRMCSINASMSHAPVIAAVAQRGSHDDCIYVRVMLGIRQVYCS
jgi:transcription initiation factor TFIID subunit 15